MNTARYLSALEHVLIQLHQLSDAMPQQVCEVMSELAEVIRLGKLEIGVYENEFSEHLGLGEIHTFFDSGKASETIAINQRIVAPDDTLVVYHIYPVAGAPAWTEEELNRIQVFLSILSTFNGKTRLINLVHHLTFHDPDLDMYNVKQFMKCARILCKSRRLNQFSALRFNLKHFAIVNEYIGRENGTLVMKLFISIINDVFDDANEMVCRLGGDNFAALVRNEHLEAVLDILSGTGVIYDEVQKERVMISATVGVYAINDCDLIPTEILDRVSLAARLAKNSPKTDIVFFDEALLARSKQSNAVSANFPKALQDREFLVYYQPKVAIDGRHIAGAEALCRWMHEGRLIPPGDFIPVLEQSRDICKLDFYILDAVCKDIRRWLDNDMCVVRVSVNLSRRHLSDPDLLEHIIGIIDKNNVPHQYIEIELTETTTDVEFQALKNTIGGLQQAGISTSVDDFGIGYSSLNLIKEIPWNVLKLDKSLLPSPDDENPVQKGVMFRYIISMAQEMGLECISEGVETKEQVQLLAENNCNLAQGYYFDRPLPVEEFEKRLDKNYIYNQ